MTATVLQKPIATMLCMQRRMTPFSVLAYVPLWVKYNAVPDFVRFLLWLVWVRVRAVYHYVHKGGVVFGA